MNTRLPLGVGNRHVFHQELHDVVPGFCGKTEELDAY